MVGASERFAGGKLAHSHLDLLIDASTETGLFDLAGFAVDVERLMVVFTQVVTQGDVMIA